MKKDTLLAFAVDTPYMGCRNQILGALDAINKNSKTALPAEKCLLLPSGAETVDDMRESLCYAHFGSYRSFQNEIFALLDAGLAAASPPCLFWQRYLFYLRQFCLPGRRCRVRLVLPARLILPDLARSGGSTGSTIFSFW